MKNKFKIISRFYSLIIKIWKDGMSQRRITWCLEWQYFLEKSNVRHFQNLTFPNKLKVIQSIKRTLVQKVLPGKISSLNHASLGSPRRERPCSQMILATVSRRTDSHPTTTHSNHLKNRRKMPDRIRYKKQNVIPSRVFEKRSAVSFAASKSASLALRNVLRLARVRNRCRSARPISTRSKNLANKIEIIYLFLFCSVRVWLRIGNGKRHFFKIWNRR